MRMHGLRIVYALHMRMHMHCLYLQRTEPAFLAYGSAFATTTLIGAYTHGGLWLEAMHMHALCTRHTCTLYAPRRACAKHAPSMRRARAVHALCTYRAGG